MDETKGILFDESFQKELKGRFCYPDGDPKYGERLFFDNSGGSLRLRSCVEAKAELEMSDLSRRIHARGMGLKELAKEGAREILEIIFGAKSGALMTELTASQTMFQMVGIIMENTGGKNAVTSAIEHPSAYDAMEYYCRKTGKEMRVVPANHETGGIDPDEVVKYIDQDTCLLSIMAASNISGTIMDLEEIARRARQINPDIYIISDAVQHAPHCTMDVDKLQIDGMNFAPYKFFGVRGCGFAYVSDRVANMPHHRLLAKEQKTFELGTCSPGNFAAAMEIINYVCSIGKHFIDSDDRKALYKEGMRRIHLQERALLYRMLEGTDEVPGLRHIDNVEVYVDMEDLTYKDLIVAMGIKGIEYSECVQKYLDHGVTVFERLRSSMYSKRIVEALGIEGAIRVSPLHCNSTEDIDEFLRITKKIAESV